MKNYNKGKMGKYNVISVAIMLKYLKFKLIPVVPVYKPKHKKPVFDSFRGIEYLIEMF